MTNPDVTFSEPPIRATVQSRCLKLQWPGQAYPTLMIIYPDAGAAMIMAEAINAAIKEAARPQPITEPYPGRQWRYVAAPQDAP